jgi:hypothetical protein
METDRKLKKDSFEWFSDAIRDNLDFMLKELPTLAVPEEISTPVRYALTRAWGRCDALEGYARNVDYVLGDTLGRPGDLNTHPPALGRDIRLMLDNLNAQVEELTSMVSNFQAAYESHENYHALGSLSVLLHESVGNILYLRMRMRYLLTETLSQLTDVARLQY